MPYLTDPAAAPLREFAVAERFSPNGFGEHASYGAMARDARWKLVRRYGQPDALFDMLDAQGNPIAFENPSTGNLNDVDMTAEESAALARLQAALSAAIAGQ